MKLCAAGTSGDVGSGEKGLHELDFFVSARLANVRLSLSSPLLSLHARVHLHLNTTMIMPMVHNTITSTIDTIQSIEWRGLKAREL